MVVVDGQGIPLGIHVTSASPSEVTLVEPTLDTVRVPRVRGGRPRQKPPRLGSRGITVIVPYSENRVVRPYEDGRFLRRYRHRWIIERTFAWLGSFRRLLVRHERLTSMYRAFLYFAAAFIALRRF
jgi:transposase